MSRKTVSEIFTIHQKAEDELDKNTKKAAEKGSSQIENFGRLINKIDITHRILTKCILEVEIPSEYEQFL